MGFEEGRPRFNHILANQSLARKRRDCPEPKAQDLPRPLGSQSAFARRNIRRKTPTAISRVNPAETDMEMRSTAIGLIKVDFERA